MRAPLLSWSFLALSLLSPISAQNILNDFSFGLKQPISSTQDTVPNWSLAGSNGNKPKVMSDKVILTPAYPGHRRGAIWADKPLPAAAWSAEVDFRVSGLERGSGNLQVWFVKEKGQAVQLASVHTADKFDGLTVVLDQQGGTGGMIRGFLNDGTIQFKSRSDLDKLAFGHCQYSYRNLGRMSKLKLTSDPTGFEVSVDDKTCFKSEKMALPTNYYLGVTAASADNPDSIEIGKFVLIQRDNPPPAHQQPIQQQQQQPPPPQQQQQPFQQMSSPPPPAAQELGSVFTVLQQLQSTINGLDARIAQQASEIQKLANVPAAGGGGASLDQISTMGRRLEAIEKNVETIKHDLESKDFRDHLQEVHDRMEDIQHHMESFVPSTSDLAKMIKSASPRLGFFIFVILAFQGMLAGSYIVYKRRRANSPKKFL